VRSRGAVEVGRRVFIRTPARASIRLVRRGGFRREGFSPRYLKIFGRWRDHQRWALTADRRPT